MDPENEKYVQELIEKMKIQNKMITPSQMPFRNPEPITNYNTESVLNKNVLNNVQNSTPSAPAQGAFEVCSQCGTMHPPVERGKVCPVSGLSKAKEDSRITEDSITQFVSNLRNIALSQIQSKKIKDGNKLFKHLTITFMKTLEEYKE